MLFSQITQLVRVDSNYPHLNGFAWKPVWNVGNDVYRENGENGLKEFAEFLVSEGYKGSEIIQITQNSSTERDSSVDEEDEYGIRIPDGMKMIRRGRGQFGNKGWAERDHITDTEWEETEEQCW